jgi:UDP-N-acetyl-D-mannosaminuronate dehydrogenase
LLQVKPLIAHSFERVIPGRNYVASIRDFWRVCSGINLEARQRVTRFLSDILMGKIVAASKVAILGASYREDVGDTRYSGSEVIVRKLTEMGAELVVHDPYVKHWWELEKQDTYPAPGHSWARFFRNQEGLKETRMQSDLEKTLKYADAIVLAVRHNHYLQLEPDEVIKMVGHPAAIIDCFGILNDDKIHRYFELDCEVKGLGRGHVKRIKNQAHTPKNQK